MVATRKWAGDVLDTAWQVIIKAGRLVDEVDFLLPRLQELNDVPTEQGERMQMDKPPEDKKDEGTSRVNSRGPEEDTP